MNISYLVLLILMCSAYKVLINCIIAVYMNVKPVIVSALVN